MCGQQRNKIYHNDLLHAAAEQEVGRHRHVIRRSDFFFSFSAAPSFWPARGGGSVAVFHIQITYIEHNRIYPENPYFGMVPNGVDYTTCIVAWLRIFDDDDGGKHHSGWHLWDPFRWPHLCGNSFRLPQTIFTLGAEERSPTGSEIYFWILVLVPCNLCISI